MFTDGSKIVSAAGFAIYSSKLRKKFEKKVFYLRIHLRVVIKMGYFFGFYLCEVIKKIVPLFLVSSTESIS